MLYNAKSLYGFAIHATDGDIGHVDQFYFDDEQWALRYIVADTGPWLTGRKVLLSPIAVSHVDWAERKLSVSLTRDQVEHSPDIDTRRPVTRHWETGYHEYYEWPVYWAGASLWGAAAYPSVLATARPDLEDTALDEAESTDDTPPEDIPEPDDSHLQSTKDVAGYHIEAANGEIGHVVDFIVDDENWAIRYIEVDTRNWWPGKKVLIAPSWIARLNWPEAKVHVKLLREVIQQAPEYDPSVPITREYEVNLFDYYGQFLDNHGHFRYWIPEPPTT